MLHFELGKDPRMLTTTYDSELMVQQVAAVAVPSCSSFFTVADENCLPMVFSVGTDQKFYLIKEDVEGAHSLSDFGSLLRLAEDYVAHSLSVTQDADSNIFIVLAIEDKSATDADPNRMPSIVKVFRPFKPEDYDLASPSTDLSSLILPQKGESENFRAWTIFAVSAMTPRPVLLTDADMYALVLRRDQLGGLPILLCLCHLSHWTISTRKKICQGLL